MPKDQVFKYIIILLALVRIRKRQLSVWKGLLLSAEKWPVTSPCVYTSVPLLLCPSFQDLSLQNFSELSSCPNECKLQILSLWKQDFSPLTDGISGTQNKLRRGYCVDIICECLNGWSKACKYYALFSSHNRINLKHFTQSMYYLYTGSCSHQQHAPTLPTQP